MNRRKPQEHLRRTLRGLIVLINKNIRYAKKNKNFSQDKRDGITTGVSHLSKDIPTEVPAQKTQSGYYLTEENKPRRPVKPLPPALQGKTQDIAERSNGTFTGFMDELDKEGYVVFDYETTGLGKDGNVPVQVGAVKIKNGKVVERLNLFTNPQRPLGKWALENLKDPEGKPLTDEWLASQASLHDAHVKLADFIGDHVLVAHNYPFDGEVLERIMKEEGIDFSPAGSIDTFSLAKQLVPRSYGKDPDLPEDHKLSTLAEFYEVPLGDGAHTADADCEAAALILRKILEHGEKRGVEPHMLDRKKQQERYERAVLAYEEKKAEYENYQREKKEKKANAVRVSREQLLTEDPF